MPKSIKTNYIFNLLNTCTQLLFPLLTFPYASRIMLAEGIGQVNFYNSIISYINLFTCLGIPMYAIREIAKVRNDIIKTSITTIEILILHAILTIVGYIIVGLICITVPEVQENITLFLILSITIFMTAIGCEWFYQGIEDFKYVAIRGLIIKIISVVLLFLLVKTKDDILWYGLYNVIGILGGNIFNFIRLRKYIDHKHITLNNLHPFKHLKPALQVFVFNVIISIYLQLNTILLGFLKNVESVGYFVAATKLMYITMSIINSLNSVIMPHASNLIAEGKYKEFSAIAQKSYNFIIALSIPLFILLLFSSKSVIILFCGESFTPAIPASQIVAFNIISNGISAVLGIQILYPLGKINIVIKCTLLGAIINIIFNLILVPTYGYIGTAISFMITEIVVTLSMYFIGKKYLPIKLVQNNYLNYLIASIFMSIGIYSVSLLSCNDIINLILMTIVGFTMYSLTLVMLKDSLINILKDAIKPKFKALLNRF